ncbi:MAG: hypothetical protein ABR500_02505 [Dermatophilaceae bacterium]
MTLPSYRLVNGDTGPRQQSNVTCGSACLTVARMLVDPAFAHWISTGEGARPGSPRGGSPAERFAAYERVVHSRTNHFALGRSGLNLPWPRRLGTPPWGAQRELELGAAKQGTDYGIILLRPLAHSRLVDVFDRLNAVVSDGMPALLYVGSDTLPRHVLLILPGNGDDRLDVYDPADGSVRARGVRSFATHELRLSGWNMPWFVVAPSGPRAIRAEARQTRYAPLTDASPA